MEVKYDRFRNKDEGTWQNPLEILTTILHVCHRRRAVEKNQQVEEYKHTHTHTHTHTERVREREKEESILSFSLFRDDVCQYH